MITVFADFFPRIWEFLLPFKFNRYLCGYNMLNLWAFPPPPPQVCKACFVFFSNDLLFLLGCLKNSLSLFLICVQVCHFSLNYIIYPFPFFWSCPVVCSNFSFILENFFLCEIPEYFWCFLWWSSSLYCKLFCPLYLSSYNVGNQSWIFIGGTDVEAEIPILWWPDVKSWLIWKDPDAGKDWGQEEKGMTEDEMVG